MCKDVSKTGMDNMVVCQLPCILPASVGYVIADDDISDAGVEGFAEDASVVRRVGRLDVEVVREVHAPGGDHPKPVDGLGGQPVTTLEAHRGGVDVVGDALGDHEDRSGGGREGGEDAAEGGMGVRQPRSAGTERSSGMPVRMRADWMARPS